MYIIGITALPPSEFSVFQFSCTKMTCTL